MNQTSNSWEGRSVLSVYAPPFTATIPSTQDNVITLSALRCYQSNKRTVDATSLTLLVSIAEHFQFLDEVLTGDLHSLQVPSEKQN